MRGIYAAFWGLILATLYVASLVVWPVEVLEVEGLRHLREEEVLKAAGLYRGMPWLWARERQLAPLRAHPWVAEASLHKPAPGVLRLRLRERVPFLPLEGGWALAEDGTLLPGGAPFARGPKVLGQGPLPVRDLLILARAYPKAKAIRYLPVGFWVILEGGTVFAPKAELMVRYTQMERARGRVYLYAWGVSQGP